jgi:hypothetical protein
VIDYINEKIINDWDVVITQKVAGLLDHLSAIRETALRSLSGGPSRGIIFPDTEGLVGYVLAFAEVVGGKERCFRVEGVGIQVLAVISTRKKPTSASYILANARIVCCMDSIVDMCKYLRLIHGD